MSFNRKPSETGWFYHAPHKASHAAGPQAVPPPSQIPGLNGCEDDTSQDPQPMWIKDTDSPYIRMAKQGGRPDLLRYQSPKPRSDEPVGYPRCDWYYHDDVLAAENAHHSKPGNHEFLLPDYMVHQDLGSQRQEEQPSAGGDRKDPPRRAPFTLDNETVFRREDSNPSDKTVKLPEIRPSGYGVRAEKMQSKPVKHAPIQRTEPVKPPSPQIGNQMKYQPMPQRRPEGRTVMTKLMSHGYREDWEDQKAQWKDKQAKMAANNQSSTGQDHSPGRRGRNSRETQSMAQRNAKKDEEEERKELFKLSKFKNVPAKVQTRAPNA